MKHYQVPTLTQVTMNMTRPPVKYLNVLYHNRTNFGYFGQVWPLPLKTIYQLVVTLMFICMQKMNSIPNLFFEILSRHCTLITLSTLRMLDHTLDDTKSVEIDLQETLMFICLQKIIFISKFFLRYCKDMANLLVWELLECLTIPIKNHSINL